MPVDEAVQQALLTELRVKLRTLVPAMRIFLQHVNYESESELNDLHQLVSEYAAEQLSIVMLTALAEMIHDPNAD